MCLYKKEKLTFGLQFDSNSVSFNTYKARPAADQKTAHASKRDRSPGGRNSKKGQTCVATALYWKNNRVKCEIALASGKKSHDKRQAIKERDWNRDKSRMLKETR